MKSPIIIHMMTKENISPPLTVELITSLTPQDRNDLCDATDAAIELDGGFGWVDIPSRHILERYWNGVLAVPQRHLFVARLDGTIAGTAQLVENQPNNQAQALNGELTTFFVAPWARGKGLGQKLIDAVEKAAIEKNLCVLSLNVRESQFGAINLFKKNNYTHFGTHPLYAYVRGEVMPGHYFCKQLQDWPSSTHAQSGESA
jgi:ribosomal protein S18 acetylase RimI-like enzyme